MLIDDDSMRQIQSIQSAYAARVKRIQDDRDLSDAGKRKRLAALRHSTQQAITAIEQHAEAAYKQHITGLERQLFGIHDIPNDVQASISYRDAQDRVAEIKTGAEGQLMMRRAIRSGDGILARALFERAWDAAGDRLAGSGWGEVAEAYVKDVRPDLTDAVQELSALQQADSKNRHMGQAIATSVFTPPEIAGMSINDIREAVLEAGGARVESLHPGGGQQQPPTANEAMKQALNEAQNGVYGA